MKNFKTRLLGLTLVTTIWALNSTAQTHKPNILFILIDDLGWSDLGCYGSNFYETPNIDKLSSEGMLFTNAYSASPVCSPTRASILTGKNPANLRFTGHITSIGEHRYPKNGKIIPPKDKMYVALHEIMIPESLSHMGYISASIGKWHVGKEEKYFPTHQGFDINIAGYEHGSPPTHWGPYEKDLTWNPVIKNLDDRKPGEYLADRLTQETIDFIKNNKERPFFVYLSHYAVHTPLEAPDSLVTKYEKKLTYNSEQKNAKYAAMVENVDYNVGLILQNLDNLGLTENTVVILYSDNGGESKATNNFPLKKGKGHLYEGGIRVPLIIKWPKHIIPGSKSDIPVISDDLFPTIIDLIGEGTKKTNNWDGISLSPILLNGNGIERDKLCWYYPQYSPQAKMPGYAIRMGEYKLIEHYDPEKIELYNLEEDIGEKNNLANQLPLVVQKLKLSFKNWLTEMKPIMHMPNPNYEEDYRDHNGN